MDIASLCMISAEELARFLNEHSGLCSFLGAFLWGNSFTVFLATASGQNVVSWGSITVGAMIGNLLKDAVFFHLGRSKTMERMVNHRRLAGGYERLHALQQKYQGKDWLLFIVFKYIYGMRILSILYFGSIRYSWKRFLLFDGLAVAQLTVVLTFFGWGVGQGIGLFVNAFENLKSMGVLIAVLIVAALCLRWFWKRRFGSR